MGIFCDLRLAFPTVQSLTAGWAWAVCTMQSFTVIIINLGSLHNVVILLLLLLSLDAHNHVDDYSGTLGYINIGLYKL